MYECKSDNAIALEAFALVRKVRERVTRLGARMMSPRATERRPSQRGETAPLRMRRNREEPPAAG